ncbi:septum formation protein [Malonomonas rubra DSM 5091]|uniref:7-methyl-GTP pyrophosphatase n=1 Tax=Malonomonas rubra DSM 5091 TaxID=1122189 RepID=A0A1M6BU50_MALRU|nr:Maf family protein [Malonomonas rubra]SHI52260.1 septum formation protein [Malonomonas rubra DSM 5091]
MQQIILASTSPYRKQLLEQLQLPFNTAAPKYAEQINQELEPTLLVQHLALGKAQSLEKDYPNALIIGSDQVFVDPKGQSIGKPGCFEKAFEQLRQMVGLTHTFYTGLVLYDSRTGEVSSDVASFAVTLRPLTDGQIQDYLQREQPYDCAGSFKVEGLGIALMERMAGDDYNALIGLPLIKLVSMLDDAGVKVLGR